MRVDHNLSLTPFSRSWRCTIIHEATGHQVTGRDFRSQSQPWSFPMIPMNVASWPNLKLSPDASARSKACATREHSPGSLVISTESLATVLFQSEKGRRCDACHGLRSNLQRCTGCASYWYCGLECTDTHHTSFQLIFHAIIRPRKRLEGIPCKDLQKISQVVDIDILPSPCPS
jgi:hypothetical protein